MMKKFDTEVRLSREMSLMDATLIGVGAMIGAGIFVLTGIAAGVAGPALVLAFLLNGMVALLTAMSYAELGSCFHDAGGGYLWVKEGLREWDGFISGWMSWFAHSVACSLYALGFGAYFEHVLVEMGFVVPHLGFFSPQKILAVGIAIIFAYINFRGASETGKIGNFVTIAKIVILGIFIGFGLEIMWGRGNASSSLTPFMPNGWGGIFKAMGLTFIAFQGYEVIAQSSEEIKNPRRNIPRATFLSLLIVVPIYLLISITALGSVTPENMTSWDYLALHKETALVEVSRHFFAGGGVMILVGGLISTMSALNATIYSSSRVAFAMGRDRNFPGFFGKVHAANFTPHWGILISLVIVIFMVVSLPIEDVASAADIMFLLLFLQVNIAMISLRKKRPDLDRGFVTPFYPWLSVLAIALLLFLALYMAAYSMIAWVVTTVWITAGMVFYKNYAAHREIEHIRKIKSLERIERKEYSILVCLSNPVTVKSLTRIAQAIASKHNGELIFLHVIEVQEDQPLLAGYEETARARPLLEEAESVVAESSIPFRSIIKVSHRISSGIVDTEIEESCNFVITGRKKQQTWLDRIFFSLIDNVLDRSPAEIAILHGEFQSEKIDTILLLLAPDVHAHLALEIAPAIAEFLNAKLLVAIVIEPGGSITEREEKISQAKKTLQEKAPDAQLRVVMAADVVKGVVQQAKKADLMIMGGKTGEFLELLLAKSVARAITEQVDCPVLWLKEYEERDSFWINLFKSASFTGERHG